MQVNQLEHFEAGVGSEGYHTMTQDFKLIITRLSVQRKCLIQKVTDRNILDR